MRLASLFLLLLAVAALVSAHSCANGCSGHGTCSTSGCNCDTGYNGADCSLRSCPTGRAWTDIATSTDTAHASGTECSNAGLCDTSTGLCTCRTGFEGPACERMSCHSGCNGNGVCISMAQAGLYRDDVSLLTGSVTYSLWDANKVFGCQCDAGWAGYDCGRRNCPSGDDPLTTGQSDEVQTLSCRCDTTCSGTFSLSFRNDVTTTLSASDSSTELEAALEALLTVTDVTVSASNPLCGDSSTTTTSITFTHESGDVPPLRVNDALSSTGTKSIAVAEVTAGDKENSFCNNRGVCDTGDGTCTCDSSFSSSDGAGAAGSRGDCGVDGGATTCLSSGTCSSHGTCGAGPTFLCTCYDGWTGADCSNRTCPTGAAIFDEPSATDTAHADAECSNNGLCDTSTGICECNDGWSGAACQRLDCPSSESDKVCSGHGVCRSMSQLAALYSSNGVTSAQVYGSDPTAAATWDADLLYGCYCDQGGYIGSDGDYVPPWSGYDCSLRTCRYGEDPMATAGVLEVQQLDCTATGGTVTLTFRDQTTAALAHTAGAADVQAALQALSTIGSVTVAIQGGGDDLCSAGGITTLVTFNSELGALPLMTADSSSLTGTLTPSLSVAGTKTLLECSGRGICDRAAGRCKCFPGFGSSDGSGGAGSRGDCGYINALFKGEA